MDSPGEAAKIINSVKYGLESFVFTKDRATIDHLSGSLQVGLVHFNDVPLFPEELLPISGRKRSGKVLKGSSRHVFRKYAKFKSLNIEFC